MSSDELERLRSENEMLRRQLGLLKSGSVRIHYMYASPLILLDNLGSTVIETFDPIRVDAEYRRIAESGAAVSLSVASPSNMLRFKYWLEEDRFAVTILHISMHTVEVTCTSADGSSTKSIKCALEDDNGKGFLLTPEEFASALSPMDSVSLVFINSCKSQEIASAILSCCPSISHVICLGTSELVLESSAQLFAGEFYPLLMRMSVLQSFERAKNAVKTSPNSKISQQADLFKLLRPPNSNHLHQHKTHHLVAPSGSFDKNNHASIGPFWMGHMPQDLSINPEDFIGRQVDMVRLCTVLFGGAGRRVCAITGDNGIGKRTFLAEACKYLASPGGRQFNGGICIVQLPLEGGDDESIFFQRVVEAVKGTIVSLKTWYKGILLHQSVPEDDEEEDAGGSRSTSKEEIQSSLDNNMESWSGLKSYKVFWAETFSDPRDLGLFLRSYQVTSLTAESINRLFNELRLNGTQLQDWGSGKLVRVVHVVRLLIRGAENGQYLLEKNKEGQLRMLSKKFDPVTENVLETASGAVQKELGSSVGISRLVLRNRKPLVELNSTSPSYPGLFTKYVLYTADVELSGLPQTSDRFETCEDKQDEKKFHSWRWIPADSELVTGLVPSYDPLQKTHIEMHLRDDALVVTSSLFAAQDDKKTSSELLLGKLMHEWNYLCELITRKISGNANSALVLLNAGEFFANPTVRSVLGKALVKHTGLKILFSHRGFEPKTVFNLATSSVSYKIIHFPLPSLQPIDGAILFTRRIHRPLFRKDWWNGGEDAPPPLFESSQDLFLDYSDTDVHSPLNMNVKSSKGVANLARLARHPLLLSTRGLPSRILAVAQHVTLDLPSINDLLENLSAIIADS